MKKVNLKFIVNARNKNGISMKHMGELLGFKSAAAYFMYEKGEYEFKANMLPVLAKAFDCKIEDLYS